MSSGTTLAARARRAARVLGTLIGAASASCAPNCVIAAVPVLLHTPGYESPVRGGPDDLLMLAGSGFDSSDRVVYEAMAVAGPPGSHPGSVPAQPTAVRGTAAIVELDSPPYAITVRLPRVLERGRPYRLWVVNGAGEWSEPVSINDPRPLWITPAYVYATSDIAGIGRTLRVVGRNLEPAGAQALWIRLQGPSTYTLATRDSTERGPLQQYVSEASLPSRLTPGWYAVAVSRNGRTWESVPSQRLEVRADPPALPRFDVSDPRFGACRPSDGLDDSECFARALEAAREAGGGTVFVPAGKWDLSTVQFAGGQRRDGFVLARQVELRGAGSAASFVIRHGAKSAPPPGALLTLTGANSVLGISFVDDERYESLDQSRAVIQLGTGRAGDAAADAPADQAVEDIVVSGDAFYHVGRAIVDSGRPIRHLFVTRNEFGAYDNALLLTGGAASPSHPYRIDDAVIRWNRFVPGSYLDIEARQGTIASQLGASYRVDFSGNTADGASTAGLQESDDPKGWRAAFFWSMANNNEELLVSENRISCSGDKAGDGEAIALDGNGNTSGFDMAQAVAAAGPDWVRVHGTLLHEQNGRPVRDNYYTGHWISVVAGPGIGQTRRVESYEEDRAASTVTFRVTPGWDVIPARRRGRIILERQYWQVYVVANEVNHASPPCQKSNLNGPHGGVIGFWTPAADSTIEGNRQIDTDGIEFLQSYSARTPSCRACVGSASFLTALEIRGNVIDGEYDWSSDCSWSGIRGYFVATPTPEAPPPVMGFGIVVADNRIAHADGQRGGAIDIAHAGAAGPPPGNWPFVQNLLIFDNLIRDVRGPPPRPICRQGQRGRAAIRLEGERNVQDTVLYANRCERVDTFLEDAGARTVRLCAPGSGGFCECAHR